MPLLVTDGGDMQVQGLYIARDPMGCCAASSPPSSSQLAIMRRCRYCSDCVVPDPREYSRAILSANEWTAGIREACGEHGQTPSFTNTGFNWRHVPQNGQCCWRKQPCGFSFWLGCQWWNSRRFDDRAAGPSRFSNTMRRLVIIAEPTDKVFLGVGCACSSIISAPFGN